MLSSFRWGNAVTLPDTVSFTEATLLPMLVATVWSA